MHSTALHSTAQMKNACALHILLQCKTTDQYARTFFAVQGVCSTGSVVLLRAKLTDAVHKFEIN